jgi:hypothetical protein
MALTLVKGEVYAPTPCHLQPLDKNAICKQAPEPTSGVIKFTNPKGASRIFVVRNGRFLGVLPKGYFKVSFAPKGAKSEDFSLYPNEIVTEGKKQNPLFSVQHKSFDMPSF